VKHGWVKKMRQLIQDTYFGTALPTISISSHGGGGKSNSTKTRFSR
jgi:hypothetical protein